MTVAELLARVSSRELTEWQLYAEMEPFGEERADLRHGILCAVLANQQRQKASDKVYKPEDFIPRFDRPTAPEVKPPEQLFATMNLWERAVGGPRPA